MRVAAEHQVEIGVRRLAIHLGRMRQQDRKFARRDFQGGLFDLVHAVVVGVVDAGEVQALAVAEQRLGLVDQHPDAHFFERRRHPDRIVVAEDRVDGCGDLRAQPSHALDRGFARPVGLAAVVSGQHTKIVTELRQQLAKPPHRRQADVDMQVADLEDGKAVEGSRQSGENDGVAPDLDPLGVSARPPVQPGQLEGAADERRAQIPAPRPQRPAPAVGARFMLVFDAESLP